MISCFRVGIMLSVSLEMARSGSSAAWLARLPWEQEVGSSNLLSPTMLFFQSFKQIHSVAPPVLFGVFPRFLLISYYFLNRTAH